MQTVQPTCTADGKQYLLCTDCGEIVGEITILPAAGHAFSRWESADVESHERYCTRCGTVETASHNKTEDRSRYRNPTVDTTGLRVFVCTDCGEEFPVILPKLDHTHIYDTKIFPATCTENGHVVYTCSICGAVSDLKTENALGHDYDDGELLVEETCTQDGLLRYTCMRCGAKTDEITDALGHAFDTGTITTEPTCTAAGVKTFRCTRCGGIETQSVPTLDHDYHAVTTEPTCTKPGCTTYTCAMCGNAYVTDETRALGHAFDTGTITTEPTCTAAGVKTFTCTRCGDTETQSVPTLDHDYHAVTTEPTCTKPGCTTFTCAMCGNAYVTDETCALGHAFDTGTITTEPTCTATGIKTFTCTRCGDSKTESVARSEHHYRSEAVFPTCTDPGFAIYTCTFCGDTYTVQFMPAYGHSFDTASVTAMPTCISEGVQTSVCSRCGMTRTTPVAKVAHSFGEWRRTAAPTYTAEGEESRTCTVCGLTETRATPHLEKEPLTLDQTQIVLRYREKAQIHASDPVEWSSSNPSAAYVHADGSIVTTGSGTAVLTAVSLLDGSSAACTVSVHFLWWQTLIRIFLFGFLWY